MEKLICNKNLALSAKAPSFLSKAYKGSEGTGQQGKRDPDVYNSRHFLNTSEIVNSEIDHERCYKVKSLS